MNLFRWSCFPPSGKAEIPLILPITDFNITSHSIAVGWAVVTRRRQPIRFFTLELRKGQGAWENYPKPLNGDDRRLIVWGLEPGRLYSFRISSTIDANTSPFSKPSPPVRTLADGKFGSFWFLKWFYLSLPFHLMQFWFTFLAKYGTPRDVRITSLSPTTLTVEWKVSKAFSKIDVSQI